MLSKKTESATLELISTELTEKLRAHNTEQMDKEFILIAQQQEMEKMEAVFQSFKVKELRGTRACPPIRLTEIKSFTARPRHSTPLVHNYSPKQTPHSKHQANSKHTLQVRFVSRPKASGVSVLSGLKSNPQPELKPASSTPDTEESTGSEESDG